MDQLFQPILGTGATKLDITNSEIQTFKDCKRKWYLNYYLGLNSKEENLLGPLPLGTRVHDSLELYYSEGKNPVDVYMGLLKEDKVKFQETEKFLDETSQKKFDSEAELGRLMVEGYLEWVEEENRDADYEFVSAEKSVNVPVEIDGIEVNLMGKIDLKLRHKIDDTILITDHKTTAASAWSNYDKYSHMSEQLMYYIMLSRLEGEKVDGAMYNLLKKVKRTGTAKPPFFDRKIIRFNQTQLDSFWVRTMSTVSDMIYSRKLLDAGESHLSAAYPRPSNDCAWKCPFYQMCTMMDDGSSYDQYLDRFYEKKNPNARYETVVRSQ